MHGIKSFEYGFKNVFEFLTGTFVPQVSPPKFNMLQNLKNLFKLCKILKTRGNWPLIRKSKKQLWEFLICRNGLIQKPFFSALVYWFHMLKGLDILVWRLETFGFLFSERLNEDDRKHINKCLK